VNEAAANFADGAAVGRHVGMARAGHSGQHRSWGLRGHQVRQTPRRHTTPDVRSADDKSFERRLRTNDRRSDSV
jgi:hypothetical protein